MEIFRHIFILAIFLINCVFAIIETPYGNLNLTESQENRVLVCMLLYYNKWEQIKDLDIFKTNNTDYLSELRFKAKSMILDTCNKTIPQELVDEVIFLIKYS